MYIIVSNENEQVGIKDTSDGVIEYFNIKDIPNIANQVNLVGFENGKIIKIIPRKEMIDLFNRGLVGDFLSHFPCDYCVEFKWSKRSGTFRHNYVYTLRKSYGEDVFSWADHDLSSRRRDYCFEEMLGILKDVASNATLIFK